MKELEATTSVVAEPTTFWTYFSRFTILLLWFLTGLAFIFTLAPWRLLPDIFLLAFVILWIRRPHLRKAKMLAMVFTAFLLMEAYLPFDISMFYWPGKPRVVQLVMGLPKKETVQRAQRGEVALGGCIVMGNEPRWILIW
jgi:hypothetical protein